MDRPELTTTQAFKMQFDSNSLLLRTTLPAQVVGVDLSRNTVDVQPVLRGKIEGQDDTYLLPVINDVPIQYYGCNNFWVTFEPKPSDYCVLSVSDRSIEAWKKAGGIIDPVLNRHHDMTDAFAYFGINPFPDAIPSIEVDTMHVRTRDGSTGIKVKANTIIYDVEGVEVVNMNSAVVNFLVPVNINQTLDVTGQTTLGNVSSNNKNIGDNHAHSGVQSGGSNTGGVV